MRATPSIVARRMFPLFAACLGCTSLVGLDEFTKRGDLADATAGDAWVDAPTDADPAPSDAPPADSSVGVDSAPPVDAGPACPSVQELYTGKAPYGLVVTPTTLYWGRNCSNLQACDKSGCPGGSTPVTSIPITCSLGVAGSGSDLYALREYGGLWSCKLPGCTGAKESALLGTSGIGGYRVLYADATGAYVQDQDSPGSRFLVKVPPGGGTMCKLGALPDYDVRGYAVVGGRIYVTHGKGSSYALGWFPIDCSGAAGGVQPFVTEREGLSSVVANGTTLYWTEARAIVRCVGAPDCTGAPFATDLDSQPTALASDAAGVYWLTAGGIFSCPHTGCGAGAKRLSCEGCATTYDNLTLPSLATDEAYVYMGCRASTTGRVIRVAK